MLLEEPEDCANYETVTFCPLRCHLFEAPDLASSSRISSILFYFIIPRNVVSIIIVIIIIFDVAAASFLLPLILFVLFCSWHNTRYVYDLSEAPFLTVTSPFPRATVYQSSSAVLHSSLDLPLCRPTLSYTASL